LISGFSGKTKCSLNGMAGFTGKHWIALVIFFVQNETSKKILFQLGKSNVAISGDTF
jgi:3-deoxy-D-manno-octulosonic-acid transferase